MNDIKNKTWKTKYGRRRVRQEAPTLDEAIAAAQGLTDDTEALIEVAAALIGLPRDQVRSALLKAATPRKDVLRSITLERPSGAPRSVVVERKPSRRTASAGHNGRSIPGHAGRASVRDH
jgi:hypothetical protein